MAAIVGHTNIVKLLLDANANVDAKTRDGRSALMTCAHLGKVKMVELLLGSMVINVNAKAKGKFFFTNNPFVLTPRRIFIFLSYLTLSTSLSLCLSLLFRLVYASASSLASLIRADGTSALVFAISSGHTEIVQMLIDSGAKSDSRNLDNLTALMVAAGTGASDIVKLLLEANASIDLEDSDGATALHFAALNGHTNVVQQLVDRNVNGDIPTEDGLTPLMMAASQGHYEIVQLLCEHGVNVDVIGKGATTAFMIATLKEHVHPRGTEIAYLIDSYSKRSVQDL